jgi:hypothetical protein
MGPVTPTFRPICDSVGSGQVSATHRGIAKHAAMATGRSSVHCCPKGGGVMHHRLSCGRLDQPIESEPVVQAASCIVRSVMSRGAAQAAVVPKGRAHVGGTAEQRGQPRKRERLWRNSQSARVSPLHHGRVTSAPWRRMSGTWVTQVRRPGWHPHDRRPHLQEEFSVRGRYKGTYSVQSTPVPGNAWSEAVPVPPSPKQAITPDWDAVTRGIALPQRRLADLRNALGLWRRKTRAVNQVRELVRSRWHGDSRRAFTRWCVRAAATAASMARLTRYKLRERERAVNLDTAAVDQACARAPRRHGTRAVC